MIALGQSIHIVQHAYTPSTVSDHHDTQQLPKCNLCITHFEQVITDNPLSLPETPISSTANYRSTVPYGVLSSITAKPHNYLRAPPYCA